MFGKKSQPNSLEPPPLATDDDDAVEVLRVWTAPDAPQQITLRPTWDDPGAWGLMLVDIAHHVANAFGNEGRDRKEVLLRIRELWDAEWDNRTDEANDITRS